MKSSERLRRWIVAAGGFLIVAFIGSAVWDGWRLHQQLMRANERELSNLANALAEEAAHTLQAVDILLRDTGHWYQHTAPALAPEAIGAALASQATSVPEISALTVVDAQGMQRYRSRTTAEPLADVSDRPYFQVQRDRPDAGLFVNPPLVTRVDRVPVLVISRRLDDAQGRFAGVITASVTLQRLQAMYAAIHLDRGSALLLALDDGTVVVRQPPAPGLGTRYPELAVLKQSSLFEREASPLDGKPTLVAAVGVGKLPLTLAVTRAKAEALRPWYEDVWSGTIRTVLLSLLVVATIVGMLRQLRRLELGDQALRQSEERYAMAMEAANEGHAEWNVPQGTVFASDQWRALHGVSGRAPPERWVDLLSQVDLHADDAAAAREAIDAHLAGRTPAVEIEYRVRHADGGWHWIHARGRCLRDGEGAALRLFLAATDVSARKQAEADKAALESRLQQTQRLEALGTLAGGIAHDFNNILGAILGFGEMAQQQAPAGSALRRHIDRVMQGGARARLLVKRILDFSRSGVAERAHVPLQALVEEVLGMLAPSLPSGIAVDAQLASGRAAVLGDATQLYQVVMNLCTNAAQAMGDAGVLSVRLERVQVAQRQSLLHGDLELGPHLCLVVADTGAGVAPDVLQRMFDPFFTTKKVGEGTGLGLSVVHGIVADLGGAIDVASGNGAGTRVSVWLPVVADAARQPAASPARVPDWPQGQGQTVMVVDDERALVELAEELLAGLGYEPVGFDTSEAALRAFEADPQRFDAVLTDEMLPGMPGSEFARRVLALRPELPVLLMSGNVSVALEQRARSAKVAALLRKPLTLRELADKLAQLLAAQPSG